MDRSRSDPVKMNASRLGGGGGSHTQESSSKEALYPFKILTASDTYFSMQASAYAFIPSIFLFSRALFLQRLKTEISVKIYVFSTFG